MASDALQSQRCLLELKITWPTSAYVPQTFWQDMVIGQCNIYWALHECVILIYPPSAPWRILSTNIHSQSSELPALIGLKWVPYLLLAAHLSLCQRPLRTALL